LILNDLARMKLKQPRVRRHGGAESPDHVLCRFLKDAERIFRKGLEVEAFRRAGKRLPKFDLAHAVDAPEHGAILPRLRPD
jgi:hypothetical protein